ncbi:uncharacterized protein C8R40DRAFT_1100455 [Lentinula edodes]|uniref:uncharacterized protein n=1 Tax=Lentinula edodes TaxID=5353 RepID=UPI001BF7FCFD|nr:uncharacterized protein C8R40DRAFT_1100455 [Lentinula edodes]KAF8827267.1 hypothetical protein HHX47_DHR5000758 [Lentinula edodes]KAH7876521.1 hypothetical protein C8R40DRAFT_1100455 [Lentinula edodes]
MDQYVPRDFVSAPAHTDSAPSTPDRSAGKIRIPPLSVIRKPNTYTHREIFGTDDEYEDDRHQDNDPQRFLDSLDFDPHNMTIPFPSPRKIAGSKRVVSAQNAQRLREQAGWKAGELSRASAPTQEVFQSITATPNLSGGSFEEFRAECYAQSYIATGGPPPPSIPLSVNAFGVYQPAQSIPPTFQPCLFVNQPQETWNTSDVEMSDA